MLRFRKIKKHGTHFLGNQQGAIMPIIAVMMITLVLAVGSAIDAGRGHLVKAKLSSALDAAGLAAGSNVSTANLQAEATKYFNANYPTGYLGSTVTSVTATANSDTSLITLNASATVPTTFMKISGTSTMNVAASSEITRASKGLELVLVVDNSGSMDYSAGSGNTRLEAVQDATQALLNILYGANNTVENLWVGVVPFSQAVNIGSTRTSWVNAGSFSWGNTSWGGCVEARTTSNRDKTDDTPTTMKFTKYYSPCLSSYNGWYGTGSSKSNCSKSSGWGYKSSPGSSYGPNQYCSKAVQPLTASKSAISSKVNSLEAIGSTHTNLGVVWAWRMLSPKWQGFWGGEMNTNGLPLAYNTENMSKAVIILSDGDNQHIDNNYSAYSYLSDGRLGTTSSSQADNKLDQRTQAVCDAMKGQNIIIYAIAFGTGISSQGKALMQGCASKDAYYFESPDSDDLQQVFSTIGDSLANLRVSK